MNRLTDFIKNIDIIKWLKIRNILNVLTNILDSIMKLSVGQTVVVLLILILREAYFKDSVDIESITGSVYIFYAMSAVLSAVLVVFLKSQELLTIILSVVKMSLSLAVIGLTTSNIKSLDDCSNLAIIFVLILFLSKLLKKIVSLLDVGMLTENDILNLDRTDKVIKIVRQTRASKIEDQDQSTNEISYHLSLIVKDYRGKSYELNRLVYSRAYNEFFLMDSK